ncbi:hypothetical protein GCM10027276_28410 [Comamonas piscis]
MLRQLADAGFCLAFLGLAIELAQLLEEVLNQGLFLRIHLGVLAVVVSRHMGGTVRLRKGGSVKLAFYR